MDIELYFTVMAGMVLAFFLMVGELVALRKVGMRLYSRLQRMRSTGRKLRCHVEMGLICLFFLVQPFIVGWLVIGVLDRFNPHFTVNMVRELKGYAG